MKRVIIGLMLSLWALFAYAGQPHFSAVVSATQTNTNTAIVLPSTPQGNEAHTVIIINDGANEVYFNITTGVATVSGAYVSPGEALTITSGAGAYPITNVGLICDTGETATVRLFAFPSR